ncbi:transposase [Micromonospora sp. A200]|uniref:transposase n=1 Tax=Micromonospora sp. A200 TaxID=2940568 RepID=UPI002476C33F|nr:transposase [Micromonospora sp. A200]
MRPARPPRRRRRPGRRRVATKPALARQMIAAALDTNVPAAWVIGDEVYGADPGLRADLEHRGIDYALAVGCNRHVHVNDGRTLIRVDDLADRIPTRELWGARRLVRSSADTISRSAVVHRGERKAGRGGSCCARARLRRAPTGSAGVASRLIGSWLRCQR